MMHKRPLFFAFLALCLGIWVCSAFHIPFLFEQILPLNHIKNFTTAQPKEAYLAAIIVTDPAHKSASYDRQKTTFTAKAVALYDVGARCSVPLRNVCGLANVTSFDDRDANLEYGDYILIKGDLSMPFTLRNPGCFNYSEYLARQGIYSVITVRKGDFISVIKKDQANHFVRKVFGFRHRLNEYIKKYMPGTEGNILSGILLGDRSGIENDLKDKFIETGTVHVLVISGLNIGLIASIFILILRLLWLPRYIAYPVASMLVILYAVLTGADTPVARAAIMAVAVLLGTAFNRKVDILNCLGLAGIIVLLKNPQSLFDASFQLSFATVVSIVIFTPKLGHVLGVDFNGNKIIRYLKGSVAVSLAAWAGIIPIIAHSFNMISPVCILANIPVVLLLSIATAAGLAFLAACFLAPFLASVFAAATEFIIAVAVKAVVLFSNLPFGFFRTHSWNSVEIISFYIALAAFGLALYKKNLPKTYAAIAALIFLNILVWQGALQTPNSQLQTTVLDVGHGDAIVLEFPGGGCALIDTGKKAQDLDTGEDIITPYLLSKRISRIDAIFISHYDDDHSGGLKSVLKNFKVGNIFDLNRLSLGDKITGFKDTEIIALNPPQKHFSGIESVDNNNSLVLKIIHKGKSILFCADIEEYAMARLLELGPVIRADVIKIPHHGSAVGPGGEAFIRAVSPEIALISASAKDVPQAMFDLLRDIKCRVYKTYSDGAIILSLDLSAEAKPHR